MKNSDDFIKIYNGLDKILRKQIKNKEEHTSFSSMINEVAHKNAAVKNKKEKLIQFGRLRNAIVHEKGIRSYPIAEPHEIIVKEFREIYEKIKNPEKVFPKFNREVICFKSDDSIENAMKLMYEKSYSQIPIYEENKFKFLLTTNTIVRWIGSQLKDEIYDFNDIKILELLKFEEEENYKFISRETNLFEIIENFKKFKEQGKKIEALLITDAGKKKEKLMGIITISDLAEIFNSI